MENIKILNNFYKKEKNMSSPNSKLPNLSTKTEEFITELEKNSSKPLFKMSPEKAREFLEDLQSKSYREIEADVSDCNIFTETAGDIQLRIVKPKNTKEKLPVILYIHGGGWILGSAKTHDMLIRKIAVGTNSAVIFPEYTRSPEAKYPQALNQIYAVLCYLYENPEKFNIDKEKIVIAGDSAGGNMATVTAIMTKKQNGPKILFQCLLYPVTNSDMDTQSYEDFQDGPYLSKKAMEWFWDAYLPDKNLGDDIFISPLKAEIDDLKGLPPALIVTDENDVLRDEGEAYARKLDMADVETLNIRINGTIHDFLMLNALSDTPQANEVINMICTILKNKIYN